MWLYDWSHWCKLQWLLKASINNYLGLSRFFWMNCLFFQQLSSNNVYVSLFILDTLIFSSAGWASHIKPKFHYTDPTRLCRTPMSATLSLTKSGWVRSSFRQICGHCLVIDLSVQSRHIQILSVGLIGSKFMGPYSGIQKQHGHTSDSFAIVSVQGSVLVWGTDKELLWVILRTIFTGQMTKPTVSKHWRKTVGRRDQAWIPPEPLHHVTTNKL